MEKKIEVLIKLFEKSLSNGLDIDGVTILPSGRYTSINLLGENYKVPLLKIKNPNNIPFSYNSLHDLLYSMYIDSSLIKIVGISDKYLLTKAVDSFFVFDDFNRHDFYIPDKTYKNLYKCLNTDFVEIKFRDNKNTIYTIKLKYFIDNNFDMYWDSGEEFKIDISVKVDSLWIEKLEENEHYFETDKEEIESIVYDIYSQESYIFEQPIWDCVNENLAEYNSFLNTEWQYITINIYVK